MSKNEITGAIKQICEEKNITYESVIDTIQQALAAAFRKDFGEKNQNIKCEFFPETGKIRAFDVKTVVEDLPVEEEVLLEADESEGVRETKEAKKTKKKKIEGEAEPAAEKIDGEEEKEKEEAKEAILKEEEKPRFNPRTDLQLSDAKKIKKTAQVGDIIKTELEIPDEFGRMAAQTAKQVIIQRLREAERSTLFQEYKAKEGQVLTGIIQRQEGRLVLVDLGNATAVLPPDQQIQGENYHSGQRYRFYIAEVREASRGPEIIVSRINPEIVRQLFSIEVPEISSGTVIIKAISREAGSRSKVAVATEDASIDPIGSCVGQRGTRIQTIINELGGEKIDIIEYSEDLAKFVSNALSPAKTVSVEVNEKEKTTKVKVRADQLSLAIGKAGQNVRLAAKLTGWRIDIVEATVPGGKSEEVAGKTEGDEEKQENKKTRKRESKDGEETEKLEIEKLEIKKLRNEDSKGEKEKKGDEEVGGSEDSVSTEEKGKEE